MDECIPSSSHVEGEIEKGMLTEALNKWVGELPQMDRIIFLRRYWFGESLKNHCKNISADSGGCCNPHSRQVNTYGYPKLVVISPKSVVGRNWWIPN